MLTQVVIQSTPPMTLKVEDIDPAEILILKSITGLSPEGITLFTGDFARDGGYYQGRRIGKRNVVLTFKLNPNYATPYPLGIEVSDIRELLYKMFLQPQSTTHSVQVMLDDDRKPDRYFIGYCESITTDMWAQSQEAQVSLVCVDPYIRSVALTTFVDAAGVLTTPIVYDGSATTGLIVKLKVAVATSILNFALNTSAKYISLTTTFAVNDIIDINTTIGSRSIKKNNVDIMGTMGATAGWPMLVPASTSMLAGGSAFGDGKVKIMEYSWRSAWWGI